MGVALAIVLAVPAGATSVNINFETPPFPTTAQPSDFNTAGAMQTYTQASVFSITGGVVLGNPTFLPEFAGNGGPFGGPPNLYGTTDVADPTLQSTITLTLDPSQVITSVTGVLFNGQNTVASGNTESYTITAFSNGTQVDQSTPSLSTDLTSPSSVTTFSLSSTSAMPITMVTFTTPNASINGWDFLVDSIVAQGGIASIPEPSTIVMGGTALLFALVTGCRRGRRAAA
jgi:hypothetical protein